jgi:gas vesicle protein
MRRFMTFLAGTICGALVGAVTALLLAPYAGEELRSRALDRIEVFRDEIREAYSTRAAQMEAELEALRNRPPLKEE